MKSYDTYIFDLDGTLLNSLPDLVISTNYALAEMGFSQRTTEEVRTFIGNGVRLLIERAVPNGTDKKLVDKCFDIFKQYYLEHGMDNTKPYDGVISMLGELKNRGKRTAVVSNKFYDATQELCEHYFGSLLDVAIGENNELRKKPAPDIVFEALRQMETVKEEAVYIGDSDVDIQTARNCGLPCISVLWGYRDKKFLLANGASEFISSPSELIL